MSGKKFFKRDEIIGRDVYDLDGKYVGKVAEVGFDSSGGTGLIVEIGRNKTEFFEFSAIYAIGDIILVKGKPSGNNCPYCGHPIKPNTSFCTKCGTKL